MVIIETRHLNAFQYFDHSGGEKSPAHGEQG
jgi:hypothetical protein